MKSVDDKRKVQGGTGRVGEEETDCVKRGKEKAKKYGRERRKEERKRIHGE